MRGTHRRAIARDRFVETRRIVGFGRLAWVVAALVLVAGCGASGPQERLPTQPSGAAITAAPSVAPDATPAALPGADAATAALKGFAKLVNDPELSYRVTATLVERFESRSVRTVFTGAAAGEDYRGSAKSGKNTVGFAYVDGQGWAKPHGRRWIHGAIHQMQADDAVRPWETLCWLDDLAYTGRPGELAEGFAYACPPGYEYQNRRLRSVGAHGRIDVLALVLDADGTPLTMHIEGEHPDLAGRATPFSLDLAFKDVGEPITIKAP